MAKSYQSLGEAIQQFIDRNGLRTRADSELIAQDWAAIMGEPISRITEKLWLQNDILFLKVESPIWKTELLLQRSNMVDLINRHLGRKVVHELRIV